MKQIISVVLLRLQILATFFLLFGMKIANAQQDVQSNPKFLTQGLWGMTFGGGDISDCGYSHGTIFRTDLNGENHEVRHSFYACNSDSTGGYPHGGLIFHNNKLYGMTTRGASAGGGHLGGGSVNTASGSTLFEFDPNTNTIQVLHFFTQATGFFPTGSLVVVDNILYGLTTMGGSNSFGSVSGTAFKYDLSTSTFTVIHNFDVPTGYKPQGTLIHHNGILYGMTSSGGSFGSGTVFQIDISNPNSTTLTLLYEFENTPSYDFRLSDNFCGIR